MKAYASTTFIKEVSNQAESHSLFDNQNISVVLSITLLMVGRYPVKHVILGTV